MGTAAHRHHVMSVGPPEADAALTELIRSRRSIRRFQDRSVPRALIAELLYQSLWSPSPHNSQPWRFTALFEHDDKLRLADAMAGRLDRDLRADGLPAEQVERQTARSRSRISTAPVVVLCSLVRTGLVKYHDQRREALEFAMAVQSVGAVLQTLFLLAHQRGIGSCWMAAPMYCPDDVRAALNLSAGYAPQALALLGYAATPGTERERRSLVELVELR